MKLLRNTEIRRGLIAGLTLTALIAAAGLFLSPTHALFALIAGVSVNLIWLIPTASRYKKLAALSESIDKILHGCDELHIEDYKEGELSVLASEIYKMTVRIREQADMLRKDKLFLADAIADISHQIKTPLTSMNLVISMLSQSDIDEKRRAELLRELSRLTLRIQELISVLLKMSKIDSGTANFRKDEVSVSLLAEKACEPLLIPIELRSQRLILDLSGKFEGDLMWSAEALGNIVKNCMEHTPEGGEIKIHSEENPLFTEITVTDTGAGFAGDDLPHIFERFYKGENSSPQSVGIGLALARMIVTEQNGTIKAENQKNSGAKFTIRFYKKVI